MSLSRRDGFLAVVATFVLGANFVAVRVGVEEMPPLLLTGFRFLFAAFPALLFVPLPKAPWRLVAAYGFLVGVVQFGLLFVAIARGMPAGLSALVLQAQVYFTLALAFLFFGERPTRIQMAGGAMGLLGLLIVGAEKARGAAIFPFLFVVGAALAWAVANLISKRIGTVNSISLMVWSSVVAPLPLFCLSLLLEGSAQLYASIGHPSWRLVGAVVFLAYPTTLFAFGLWSKLLSRNAAADIVPFGLLIPVTGLVSTHLWFGETIGFIELFGGMLVIAGVALNIVALPKRA